MKIKPAYIYVILIAALILFLVISSQDTKTIKPSTAGNIQDQEIPQDDIHSSLRTPGSTPGKDNVSETVNRRIEEFKTTLKKNPNDTLTIKEYADFLLAAHQPLNALPLYEKILKVDPKRADIHFSLTYIYYSQGNLDKAEEETKLILLYNKKDPQAFYNLGAISATRGNFEKAKKYWNDIIANNPGTEIAKLASSSLEKL
ncbi:MAG TPA: tetratricopeptide repeat protein [Ignavibacteriaceae bacterium]|nr:tetratricopeptide repeat protein [Ignavibacteriaceae bacterium]